MPGYKVELLNISKSFGGIRALRDVTLQVGPGEIHALVGENGAGKSTLMKVLSGVYRMDSGSIILNGQRVHIANPKQGRDSGIGIIYQEFSLVEDLTVAENIYLHFLNQKRLWMDWDTIQERARKLIGDLGFDMLVTDKVRNLSTSRKQVVEIAKALSEKIEILILDEPTAVLAPHETRKLFNVLRKLREQGTSIIYISHRLEEVFEIADRITVLKDGIVTHRAKTGATSQDEIITNMIGRELGSLFPRKEKVTEGFRLEVKGLCAGNLVRDLSFKVRKGEVLGFGGLVGSGRTETVRALFSADRRTGGEIYLDGSRLRTRTPRDAVRAGIGLVPEDRKTQGLLLELPVRQNMSLTDLGNISTGLGMILKTKEVRRSENLVKRLGIRTAGTETPAGTLSGGNQQKVALAKWLGRTSRVIIMDEPTRGVDVGAKAEIYRLIGNLSGEGISIIIVSSDMTELIGLCDRILVMHEGRINGELDRPEFSEENILRLSITKNDPYAE